jgi:hypothetical protein
MFPKRNTSEVYQRFPELSGQAGHMFIYLSGSEVSRRSWFIY